MNFRAWFLAVLPLASPAFALDDTTFFVDKAGSDDNAGTSLAAPFKTLSAGLAAATGGQGNTLSIRAGTYRIREEVGMPNAISAPNDAGRFLTIRAHNEEEVVLLGSVASQPSTWSVYNGTVVRTPADFLGRGPSGMFNGATGKRVHHDLVQISGTRSHPDAKDLAKENSWTIADAAGNRCGNGDTSGCFVYFKPPVGEDPNSNVYEFSQSGVLPRITANNTQILGLIIRYTQSAGIFTEGADNITIADCTLEHNSNSNDNAYGVRIWNSQGSVIRNNLFRDSLYWGGSVNSHAVCFMNSIFGGAPNVVENNRINNPGGLSVSTKSGVSSLIVRYNHIYGSDVGIRTAGERCEWDAPECGLGDSGYYGAGGWMIYGNLIENVSVAVDLTVFNGDFRVREIELHAGPHAIFNNVIRAAGDGIQLPYTQSPTFFVEVANNIFHGVSAPIKLRNSAGTTREIDVFLPLFSSNNNLFFKTGTVEGEYCTRINWQGPESRCTPTGLSTVQADFDKEAGSAVGDPLFLDASVASLQPGSPAKGQGDSKYFEGSTTDIGRWPLGGTSPASADGSPMPGPTPFLSTAAHSQTFVRSRLYAAAIGLLTGLLCAS